MLPTGDELGIILLSLKVAVVERRLQPAAGDLRRLRSRARRFPGQDAARRGRPPAAGAAAGRRRIRAAGAVRQARADRRLARRTGSASCSRFRWTGAALAAAIMGFPLMVRAIRLSIAAIDRRLETVARTLGGSRPGCSSSITLPLALPGIVTGVAAVVRAQPRRVRRDDHLRVQHSRRDADAAARDLHAVRRRPAAMRRRCACRCHRRGAVDSPR